MAEVLVGMPPIVPEADVLCPELVLVEEGRLSVRYCPFDGVNPEAKLVIVGITPGLLQMFSHAKKRNELWPKGKPGWDVIRRAKAVGGLAGSMRTNLVNVLDGIVLHKKLRIESTQSLEDVPSPVGPSPKSDRTRDILRKSCTDTYEWVSSDVYGFGTYVAG
jgi:hypothetical protein